MRSLAHTIFITIACFVLLVSRTLSMTLDITGQPGQRFVTDIDGAAVPAGTFVWVGSLSQENQLRPGLSYAEVRANWELYGSTLTRTLGGQSGRFSASISRNVPEFSLRKIYLLLTQTVNNHTPAANGSNVVAWALLSSTNSAWIFPDNDGLPPGNATVITSSQTNQTWAGSITLDTLQLAPTPSTSFARWASTAFLDNSTADTTPSGDPDHDGITNVFECLFNTNPLHGNRIPDLAKIGNDAILFSYPRNQQLPPDYERLEISADLTQWSAPFASQFLKSETTELCQYEFPISSNISRRFYRLRLPWLAF